jgi:two-component system, chemotaxis family, protein-glutamate methylesterase/glutaminase
MDVRMPNLDGLSAIAEVMRVAPTPIIVVSAEAGAEAQELSFRALQLGAIEVLAKPRHPGTAQFDRQAEAIRQAVRAVAGLVLVGRRRATPAPPAPARPAVTPAPWPVAWPEPWPPPWPRPPARARGESEWTAARQPPEVLALAASTGGPAALAAILAQLPADLPIPLLVVQHLAPGFELGMVRWLSTVTPLTVRIAEDGAALRPGTVHVAPAGRHLGVRGRRIRLTDEPEVAGFRPAGTRLFASVALEYGARGAGMVLTGMGRDGADGLAMIRQVGGYTAAQGPASSVIFGMPREALESGAATRQLELDEIPAEILRLVRRPA